MKAVKASNDLMTVANRAIDWARKEQRRRLEEKLNYVNVGATPIEKRTNGVETIYNRIAYVRYFLVVLLSGYAAEECNLVPGSSRYNGPVPGEIDGLLEDQAPNSFRFNPFSPAEAGVNARR